VLWGPILTWKSNSIGWGLGNKCCVAKISIAFDSEWPFPVLYSLFVESIVVCIYYFLCFIAYDLHFYFSEGRILFLVR
jgi:hypothetical protein